MSQRFLTTKAGIMRLLINLLITTCLLIVFSEFGWLTISHDGIQIDVDHVTWSAFGTVVLLAVILWLVSWLVGLLYGLAGCLTLGVMFLAYPFLGWATLKLTAHFMPDVLALHGFWITVLSGYLLMVVKVHPSTTTRASID